MRTVDEFQYATFAANVVVEWWSPVTWVFPEQAL
jgi:hypothetical protein